MQIADKMIYHFFSAAGIGVEFYTHHSNMEIELKKGTRLSVSLGHIILSIRQLYQAHYELVHETDFLAKGLAAFNLGFTFFKFFLSLLKFGLSLIELCLNEENQEHARYLAGVRGTYEVLSAIHAVVLVVNIALDVIHAIVKPKTNETSSLKAEEKKPQLRI